MPVFISGKSVLHIEHAQEQPVRIGIRTAVAGESPTQVVAVEIFQLIIQVMQVIGPFAGK
jgi:hypothetical protein